MHHILNCVDWLCAVFVHIRKYGWRITLILCLPIFERKTAHTHTHIHNVKHKRAWTYCMNMASLSQRSLCHIWGSTILFTTIIITTIFVAIIFIYIYKPISKRKNKIWCQMVFLMIHIHAYKSYIYIYTHTHIHTDDTCKPTFCVKAKEKKKEKTPESRIHWSVLDHASQYS